MILAHGLGGRTDLPLPAWMVMYGGATVLLVSFAALRLLWPQSRWEGREVGKVIADAAATWPRVVLYAARAVGIALFALVVVSAVVGDNTSIDNIAPVFVYVTFWVGLTLLSALVGDVWRLLNPFDTFAAAVAGDDDSRSERVARLGYWPAAAALFAFVWLELVYPDRAEPRVLAVAIILYTAYVLLAASFIGRSFIDKGEGFSALFGLLSHAAPLGHDRRGVIARPPLAGLSAVPLDAGIVAVVMVVLGSTSFDGLTRTTFWTDFSAQYDGLANTILGTVGLVGAIGLVSCIYLLAMRGTANSLGRTAPTMTELARAFAPSLLPIAFAYSVAHYFSLFVLEGQAALSLISDPLGRGWDLFGTADWRINYTLLAPTTIAWVQAGAIVLGHVGGVIAAHDRALARFGSGDAIRPQLPLLAAMVLFTIGGLFLLLGG